MIQIPGYDVNQMDLSMLSDLERSILHKKIASPITYSFPSLNSLLFELSMRSRIVDAAKFLYRSGVGFAPFEHSRANGRFWTVTDLGALEQRDDVLSSEAINDIFANGRLYRFECATAMVIILYKATLDSIGKATFDSVYRHLKLYGWRYAQNLNLVMIEEKYEVYPGDVLYFENPDYDPSTPQWQGENAIKLEDALYFGHGLGIQTAEGIITGLNRTRRSGSTTSAYLTDQIVHPDFGRLFLLTNPLTARIGSRTYLQWNTGDSIRAI